MPDLFGIDVAAILADAMGDGLPDAVLIKKTPGAVNLSNITGGSSPSPAPYPCKGLLSAVTQGVFDASLVRTKDLQVTILGGTLPSGIVPASNDRLTIEGKTYDVVTLGARDPAAATYTLLVRGAP